MNKLLFRLVFLLPAILFASLVQAQQMRIDVSGIGANQLPIAVANFAGQQSNWSTRSCRATSRAARCSGSST